MFFVVSHIHVARRRKGGTNQGKRVHSGSPFCALGPQLPEGPSDPKSGPQGGLRVWGAHRPDVRAHVMSWLTSNHRSTSVESVSKLGTACLVSLRCRSCSVASQETSSTTAPSSSKAQSCKTKVLDSQVRERSHEAN